MDLELLARTSAILLAAAGNRRGPSSRGAFDAPPRLASRESHRPARPDTCPARSKGSNCSKRSRGSKGGVLDCGYNGSEHGTCTEQCPWNGWNNWNPWNRRRPWLVPFCWLLSGLSVWRGSKAAPMEWSSEAEKFARRIGLTEPRRSSPIASRRQPACRGTLHVDRDAAAVGRRMERRVAAGRARPRIDAHPPGRSPHTGDRAARVRDLLVQPARLVRGGRPSRASGNVPVTMKC